MADVSKIQGPAGSPDNPGKKDKAAADADKFQQAMRKRVNEVSKVDPDEQKKRKRKEETEDEDQAAPQAGPTTPPELVTPFSLEQGTKKASPLDLQKGGRGISPMESAQPTKTPSPTPPYRASTSDEMADDSGLLEEESFGAGPGQGTPAFGAQQAAAPPPAPPQQAQPPVQQPQGSPGGWTPEGQQPVMPGPPESGQQQQNIQPPKGKKGTLPGIEPKLAPPLREQDTQRGGGVKKREAGLTAADLEGAQPSKNEETAAFFKQMGKKQEREEAAEQGGAPVQPFTFEQAFEEEKKNEDQEKTSPADVTGPPMSAADASLAPSAPPGPETLPPYATLHPQVQELFDRMAGVMTVMTASGMTETTITLSSPQFASSVFFGTQIIIQEFSTAPQAFNIQLNGTPQAVALFQGNADDLMAAFQSGNYNFRINRLETGYLAERPLFKRKEKASGGNQDQTGDHP